MANKSLQRTLDSRAIFTYVKKGVASNTAEFSR